MKRFWASLLAVAVFHPAAAAAFESDVFPELVYYTAIRHDDVAKAKAYLERGFDPNKPDGAETTPLFYAVKNASVEMIEVLVKYRARVDHRDKHGNTALIYAGTLGYSVIIEALIEVGADIDIQNREGMTALMKSISTGHLETVKTLIAAGADLAIQDYTGRDALTYAQRGRSRPILYLVKEALGGK